MHTPSRSGTLPTEIGGWSCATVLRGQLACRGSGDTCRPEQVNGGLVAVIMANWIATGPGDSLSASVVYFRYCLLASSYDRATICSSTDMSTSLKRLM
jgi:hypothetical protein